MKVLKDFFFISNDFNTKLMKNKNFTIKKIYIFLKYFFKLIYKYHANNKKILFLLKNQIFLHFFSFIKKNIKHIFLFNNFWTNGILSNFLVFKHTYLCKKFLSDLKFKNNLDLYLILDNFFLNNELFKSKILFISFYKTNIKYSHCLNIFGSIKITSIFLLIYEILRI